MGGDGKGVLSSSSRWDGAKLSNLFVMYSADRASSFVSQRCHEPLLLWYGSDISPQRVRERVDVGVQALDSA